MKHLSAIEQRILILRGQRVLLDSTLAELYGVETRVLIQAVKRNTDRFPEDFMLSLTKQEFNLLRSQTVTSRWGGRRTPPYAFTEQGVAMLSSVLRSEQAVKVNIEIMRAFLRLRQMLTENKELKARIDQLEQHYDKQFSTVFDAIRELMKPEKTSGRPIGFIWDQKP
jgi:hypothetical protein